MQVPTSPAGITQSVTNHLSAVQDANRVYQRYDNSKAYDAMMQKFIVNRHDYQMVKSILQETLQHHGN